MKKFPEAEFYFNLSDTYSTKNDGPLIYPHLLLALDSALRGTPLRNKLLVEAEINQKAQFLKSRKLWQSIDDLLDYSNGSRILVGPGSEDYFLQLLAFGKPEFFIQNELIEVDDLIEARKFCGTAEHNEYIQALDTFAEVSNSLKSNTSLRSMKKNKFVRQKLTQVLDVIPHHLSSKILLEYGSRLKDSQLESKYFALSLNEMLDRLKRSLNASVVHFPVLQ